MRCNQRTTKSVEVYFAVYLLVISPVSGRESNERYKSTPMELINNKRPINYSAVNICSRSPQVSEKDETASEEIHLADFKGREGKTS